MKESIGYKFSVEKGFDILKHLSGEHDQQSHAGDSEGTSLDIQESLRDAPDAVRRLAVPGTVYDGQKYRLTVNDKKHISSLSLEQLRLAAAARVDVAKESLGKKYGLKKREEMRQALKPTLEYRIGLGQGKLDSLNGISYTKDRTDPATNMGYYEGYNSSKSNLRTEINVNPNFYLSLKIVIGH